MWGYGPVLIALQIAVALCATWCLLRAVEWKMRQMLTGAIGTYSGEFDMDGARVHSPTH